MSEAVDDFVVKARRRSAMRVGGVGLVILIAGVAGFVATSDWQHQKKVAEWTEADGTHHKVTATGGVDPRILAGAGAGIGGLLLFAALMLWVRASAATTYESDDDELDEAVSSSIAKMRDGPDT